LHLVYFVINEKNKKAPIFQGAKIIY
jgi:hypothetical protein